VSKVLIFYFSQNGSTKFVSEVIENRFKERSIGVKIVDITGNDLYINLYDYNIIIFCSPIYYKREPLIWRYFIEKLGDMHGKAGYIFSTSGMNVNEDELLIVESFKDMTIDRGLKIIGNNSTVCENSYPPFKKESINRGRPNLSDIEKVDKFVLGIIDDINTKKIERAVYDVTYKSNKAVLKKMSAKFMFAYSPKIKFIESNCTKCKMCIEPCPMNNISVDDKLVFGNNCMKCYMCYMCCPNKAFEVNWDKIRGFIQKININ